MVNATLESVRLLGSSPTNYATRLARKMDEFRASKSLRFQNFNRELNEGLKVIVTCRPSYEPIDQVRRLTNFSTGELGVQLCNQLALAGFEGFCLKGSGATFPGAGEQCRLSLFNTNDDLLDLRVQTSATPEIAAVFQVAALCDYKVRRVEDEQDQSCNSPKIASRSGALTISLEPATKVIARKRSYRLEVRVGWHATRGVG